MEQSTLWGYLYFGRNFYENITYSTMEGGATAEWDVQGIGDKAMIERLLRDDQLLGGEDYRKATNHIMEISDALVKRLGEGSQWLEELEDAYIWREQVVMETAFREGFCLAVLLALEVWSHERQMYSPEDERGGSESK